MAPEKEMEEAPEEEAKKPKPRSSRLQRAREAAKRQDVPSPEDVKKAIEKARQSGFIAEHTVGPGDTLGHIAKKYYGSAYHYPLIYEANKDVIGDDPDLIIDGTVLKIPKLPEEKE